MQRFVAFLRAINVGGHTVKMDRLRGIFGSLGFGDVETFIASGNVIFTTRSRDAAALERRIETCLEETLGYEVATFLRTPGELSAILAHRPFGISENIPVGCALSVAFLKHAPSVDAQGKLAALSTATDDFLVREREAFWLCRTRFSESPVSGGLLEKTLGMPATMRNVTTVRKLGARYATP